ncbi:thiamine pyrophosphokinase [Apostasia shenzhenica]|uniref:Thiamine pyrophosphokinase n=1 Tax=Apostasia shenzhenica TaxID=1088818 RepID=A0A2I0ASI5_9ASPA|nr:thiamine pyrophosphokinase [Apostasia shenzhenica]
MRTLNRNRPIKEEEIWTLETEISHAEYDLGFIIGQPPEAGFVRRRIANEAKMEVMRHASTFLHPSLANDNGDWPAPEYALVVLNQHLPRFAPLLWQRAKLRLCADGGANRLFDGMPELLPDEDPEKVRVRYKPDVIKGDMDSIRSEVMSFYSDLGVKIVDESHDQDTTDLHKCINFISDCTAFSDKANLRVLVVGALGGRFDHEIGNINVLYRFSNMHIILLSDDCLIYLLSKVCHHEIHIQSEVEGPHCGLIPIGSPSASTTTTGLQWNLDKTGMHFGGLVSTSNMIQDGLITVHSDSDLLWTITIRKPS